DHVSSPLANRIMAMYSPIPVMAFASSMWPTLCSSTSRSASPSARRASSSRPSAASRSASSIFAWIISRGVTRSSRSRIGLHPVEQRPEPLPPVFHRPGVFGRLVLERSFDVPPVLVPDHLFRSHLDAVPLGDHLVNRIGHAPNRILPQPAQELLWVLVQSQRQTLHGVHEVVVRVPLGVDPTGQPADQPPPNAVRHTFLAARRPVVFHHGERRERLPGVYALVKPRVQKLLRRQVAGDDPVHHLPVDPDVA